MCLNVQVLAEIIQRIVNVHHDKGERVWSSNMMRINSHDSLKMSAVTEIGKHLVFSSSPLTRLTP